MFEIDTSKKNFHERKKYDKLKFNQENFLNEEFKFYSKSNLFWGEHCIQCQAPLCYKSCDLYLKKYDGRCRTFKFGIFPIIFRKKNKTKLIYDVFFNPYGKLWSKINHYCSNTVPRIFKIIEFFENQFFKIDESIKKTLILKKIFKNAFFISYHLKKGIIQLFKPFNNYEPNYFYLEIYNPNVSDIEIKTIIYDEGQKFLRFENMSILKTGLNKIFIEYRKIKEILKNRLDSIEILTSRNIPTRLLFIFANFISTSEKILNSEQKNKKKQIKCLIWDLDHTLWDGILVEMEKTNHFPKLKENIISILKELDNRGILLSIASKNNENEVNSILKKLGIDNLFLFSQINWKPKSQNIKKIQELLNIGLDSIGFIDDSEFELNEVQSQYPEISCYQAEEYKKILKLPEFKGSNTKTSKNRRKMYSVEKKRVNYQLNTQLSYIDFLRSCEIFITLEPPRKQDQERVQELIQRTNQMNFSGNRYNRNHIEEILSNNNSIKIAIKVSDKFGKYGIVGFAIIKLMGSTVFIQDLTLSCRVQSKKIEQKFFELIMEKYFSVGFLKLIVNYNKTSRNKHLVEIFKEANFTIPKYDHPFIESEKYNPKINFITSRVNFSNIS